MLIREFKKISTNAERLEQSMRVVSKYPERVPIFIESEDVELIKNKYLVPRSLTCGQLMYIIRRNIKLQPEMAVFLFFGNGILAPTGEMIGNLYEHHMDPDDHFLYGRLKKENVFGS